MKPTAEGVLIAALVLGGCSAEAIEPGQMVVTTGHEGDVWTATPAPVSALATKTLEDDSVVTLVEHAPPVERFSLGHGGVGVYELTARDASDAVVVRGRSLPVNAAGFAGLTLPLFVARSGGFSRPPGELRSDQGLRPPLAVLGGRYLFSAGGTTGDRVLTDGYDLGAWAPLASAPKVSCPTPPCRFGSLAIVAVSLAVAIGDDYAIWIDLDDGRSGDVALPAGLASFADVVGGATVVAADGSAYVVGATRDAAPTDAVLVLGSDGAVSSVKLTVPRAGAAATFVEGRGLVVGFGTDAGSALELLAPGSTAFVPIAHAADATRGAALVPDGGSNVLRAGGVDGAGTPAPTLGFALACGTACSAVPAGDLVALAPASGFALDGARVLVIGDDPQGQTGAALLTAGAVSGVPLREPRAGATAIALPTGHVALVGGQSNGAPAKRLELFVP